MSRDRQPPEASNERESSLHLAEVLSKRSDLVRKSAGNRARTGSPIPKPCRRGGTEIDVIGDDYELLAPEHYGSASNGAWTGEHAFTLADDAARAIALIDSSQSKVHLVGHSYGGGVALHVALARPSQIASLVLYEPSAFHL